MKSISEFPYKWTVAIIQNEKNKLYYWKVFNPVYNFYMSAKRGFHSIKVCANELDHFCQINKLNFAIASIETYCRIILNSAENFLFSNSESDRQKVYMKMKTELENIRNRKNKHTKSIRREFKRTCNKCQKVWYVSKYNMERLKKARLSAGLTILAINTGQGLRNRDAIESELIKLESCPNCGSQDFSEIELFTKFINKNNL